MQSLTLRSGVARVGRIARVGRRGVTAHRSRAHTNRHLIHVNRAAQCDAQVSRDGARRGERRRE